MQFFYVWSFLQIVLESLPVSSSGNVVLWLYLLKSHLNFNFNHVIETLDFDFLLHGPTLVIIGFYFLKDWIAYVRGYLNGSVVVPVLLIYCAWADLLTGVWYIVFKATGKCWFPLSVGFFITGSALLSLFFIPKLSESAHKEYDNKNQNLTLYHATLLGMVQGMSLLSGLSRFGMTYVAARYARYSTENAFKYSFLLQVPLISVAFLKGCYSFYFFEQKTQLLHPLFGFTILISTLISYFALCWVGYLVKQNRMYLFGWVVIGLSGIAVFFGP
jgi:undecaprenyl-diphosphatase